MAAQPGNHKAARRRLLGPASSAGKLEEIVFYDHPSVEARVHRALEWKATHPANPLDPPVPGE
jgi:STE24 endopeptidase